MTGSARPALVAEAAAAGALSRIRCRLALAIARPYIAAELPGWGRVYKSLVGDWRRSGEWAGFPPQLFRNKLNGCWFVADLSQWSDRSAYFLRRWYDLKLIRTLNALVGPGDTVVDIGANYGHFALAAACRVGPPGKVVAFEPNPRAMARLRVNADLNNIWWIDARDAALGEEAGVATLRVPRVNSGEATLGRSVYDPSTVSEVEIRVDRGDAALAGLAPRFIKIDVEGFETRAIAGLSGVIAGARPVITTEIVGRHLKNAGASPEILIAAMESADYVAFRMGQAGRGALAFRPFDLAEGDGDALWAPREKLAEITARLVAADIDVAPPNQTAGTGGAAAGSKDREDFVSEEVKYGLAGVVADDTAVSKVMPETNSLTYRGYAVQDLATKCRWEEVAYLIWNKELPTKAQLDAFNAHEKSERGVSPDLLKLIRMLNPKAHPMDTLRTAISFMGQADETTEDSSPAGLYAKSIRMFAQIPEIVAADFRIRKGQDPIPATKDLGFCENFFHMCFGTEPAPEVVKCFDISMTLYAEHSFNASTFTARTIASSLSDIYSAVTGAVGSLKGPLHGGANEAVMHMLKEVGSAKNAEKWMLDALREKRNIMGFGHRVYKRGDSRVPTMTDAFRKMVDVIGTPEAKEYWEMSRILDATMVREKNIYPNLDFPTGPAYYLMGFEIPIFTPIFVISRITGWTAHVMEQRAANKLVRPLSNYVGVPQRDVVPIEKR